MGISFTNWNLSLAGFREWQLSAISAGHGWPLYGDEYGRMKFGNMPIAGCRSTKGNYIFADAGRYIV
jgi:hypothetical protein